jgi:hypothetical protein
MQQLPFLDVAENVSRRDLLVGAGKAGLAISAISLLAGCGGAGGGGGSSINTQIDHAIFNLVLQLEYLEAEFVGFALNGESPLSADLKSGKGLAGPTLGGSAVAMPEEVRSVCTEVLSDDIEHIQILRASVQADAVAKPKIQLDVLGGFENGLKFLSVLRALKDLVVSGHAYGAPKVTTLLYRETETKIGFVEAYHSGNIRLLHIQRNAPETLVDDRDQRVKVGNYFTTAPGAQMIQRDPKQLEAVLFAGGQKQGGFFPDGLNGIPDELPSG